jgi:outer membrane PBP1 activator LpoA protein
MTKLLLSFILFISVSAFLPACAVRTPDTVHTEKQASREARIDALLQGYRRSIEELSARTSSAAAAGRTDFKEALDKLDRSHREAVQLLRKLREATNTAWSGVNDELQASLDRLKQAYEHARDIPPAQARPGEDR